MTNFTKGLELTHKEKENLFRESVVSISFEEDGTYYNFVTSIGMLEEASIDWRSEKYRVFGVEVEDTTLGRLIGVSEPEPPRDTAWEDVHGGVWTFQNTNWYVDGTAMGGWPRMASAFPMKRVKLVRDRASF